MTITLNMPRWRSRLRGAECHVYGFAGDGKKPSGLGRFQLFIDDDEDPQLEGTSAVELDAAARDAGAVIVNHWYEP